MNHWAEMEERSLIWGMQILVKIYLLFGRTVLQFFLYPVVSYYWLTNRKGRQASQQYLQRVANLKPRQAVRTGLFGSYLHFVSFANAIIDKLAAWSGGISLRDIEYHGRAAVRQHIEQGQGVLLLGSHLGNLEVSRMIALGRQVVVNVLVHTKHAEKFNTLLHKYAGSGSMNMLQVSEINAATAMQLQDKIDAGELVVIAADRIPLSGPGRITRAEFLGYQACFPQGPFILAALLKCPVYTLFCLKQRSKYVIHFDHFSDALRFPKKQRDALIQHCAQRYAQRLQHYCLLAPLQWFNFYAFWQTDNG